MSLILEPDEIRAYLAGLYEIDTYGWDIEEAMVIAKAQAQHMRNAVVMQLTFDEVKTSFLTLVNRAFEKRR